MLPNTWVDIEKFEMAFKKALSLSTDFSSLYIYFPNQCAVMIDGAILTPINKSDKIR